MNPRAGETSDEKTDSLRHRARPDCLVRRCRRARHSPADGCNAYNSIGLEYTLEEFGGIGGQSLNPIAVEDTLAMRDAAAADGVKIYFGVAFRNMDYNTTYYEKAVAEFGTSEAWRHYLPPGCNEHQQGLAIDVTDNQNDNFVFLNFSDHSEISNTVSP